MHRTRTKILASNTTTKSCNMRVVTTYTFMLTCLIDGGNGLIAFAAAAELVLLLKSSSRRFRHRFEQKVARRIRKVLLRDAPPVLLHDVTRFGTSALAQRSMLRECVVLQVATGKAASRDSR